MIRAARVDANHADLVAYFKAHGCEVESLARMGDGVPDLLVGWQDALALVEVKTPTGRLRPAQTAFQRRFPVYPVRRDQDADIVIRALKAAR